MLNYEGMELESACLKTFAAAWVTAVEYRHPVLFGDGVDGVEQRKEILLGVNVLLAVS